MAKGKNSNYFRVPNDVFDKAFLVTVKSRQREISTIEKLVLIFIYRCSNNADSAFPSYTTIASKCGISRRTAINAVNVLADNKLIKKTWRKSPDVIDNKKNQTNVYQPSIGEYDAPLSELCAPSIVNDMHHPSAPDAPRRITTYKEPIKEEPFIKKEEIPSFSEKEPEEKKIDLIQRYYKER